jgi:SAM-dependent methyltransferase
LETEVNLNNYKLEEKCRICSSKNLKIILDLGEQPPSNSFLDIDELNSPESKFPLRLFWCKDCYLVQLLDIVDKEYLFKNYFYMTSASKPIVDHFKKYAQDVYQEFLQEDNSFVVEIGSNDGSLLKEFKKLGVSILGIEPATNLSELANQSNVTTKNTFFSSEVSKEIIKSRDVSVVIANNVIAHIENLQDLMNGIKILIGNNGVFIFEVPYLVDLIENLEFDTIYHEHLSYFSILPLLKLVKQFGLEIFDIKKQLVHGGTLRIFVSQKDNYPINNSVNVFLNEEHKLGLDKIEFYHKFSTNVEELKKNLLKLLTQLKKENKSLLGYGAPAKGNVLLNYCGINTNFLDCIIDTTPLKQGKYTPGMHIPIIPPKNLKNTDVALLLAWNYESEILLKENIFRKNGGKFLIPLPKPIIK